MKMGVNYYPFGLAMAGISDKALKSNYAENRYRFQKQELQNHEFSDGSGLEMYEFKYRFEDDQTGRLWSVDPLANDYVYNSPYAFSEDKVTGHVELEGLEARSIISGEAAGGSGWVATAMSGSAPTTPGPGEALVGAAGAFFSGACHGMVKAYDMVFGSSPAPMHLRLLQRLTRQALHLRQAQVVRVRVLIKPQAPEGKTGYLTKVHRIVLQLTPQEQRPKCMGRMVMYKKNIMKDMGAMLRLMNRTGTYMITSLTL